ncbi:hypothetical protein CPLU01_10656 [Colletotrichum plurivorum]|uniref:C2H2-type domain-containing protein n=1 Tax=Colletotrichum plurivorum TaxID=2175906 RepID=A0A8H6N906_9PEZI|nr:hypothetical protein CPLU01_10656 [Colletotrichum plurivorum]
MRRTGAKVNVRPTPLQAPRWAASLLSSRPSSSSLAGTPSSTSKPRDAVASEPELPLLTAPSQVGILPIDSPEPARIVSDIIPEGSDSAIPLKLEKDTAPIAELLKQLPPADEVAGKKPSMAQSAKIQQLQQAWLESNGSSSSTGIGASGSNDQSPAPKDWLADRSHARFPSSGQSDVAKALVGGGFSERPQAKTDRDAEKRLDKVIISWYGHPETLVHPPNSQAPATAEDPEASASASAAKPGFIRIDRTARNVESSDDGLDYEMPDVAANPSEGDDDTDDDTDDDSVSGAQRPGVPAIVAHHAEGSGVFEALTTVADGSRRYDQYPSVLGVLEQTHGALMPGEYKLWEDHMRPWICPMRTCRTVFARLAALGMHFKIKHKNATLNDNLDGTLTQVSELPKEAPSIIVSRNPIRGDAEPLADPNLPGYKPISGRNPYMLNTPWKKTATRTSLANTSIEAGNMDKPNRLDDPYGEISPEPQDKLREYVKYFLSPAYRLPAERPDFKALLKLPLKRGFPPEWQSKHTGVGGLAPKAAISLLVFLTGDISATPCAVCTDPTTQENTLTPCIVLCSSAPSWLQETVSASCASCQWRTHYKRWKNTCTLTPRPTRSTPIHPPLPKIAPAPAVPNTVTLIPPPALFPYAPPRRADPAPVTGPTPAATAPKPPTPVPVPRYGSQAQVSNGRPSSPPTRRVTRHSLQAAEANAPAPAGPSMVGNEAPADMLEMEDWEVAPGRVRDERSASPTNVAFSNAYLTSNQAVSVSEDIAFNVIVVKPGGTHRWTEDHDKVRICSLAGGKLSVKLDKTEPFQIGPNGMFKVKPGTACSVENRMYVDAVIHVTSVAQY